MSQADTQADTQADRERDSLKDFDAYADRNGQDMGQDSPLDVARPAQLQAEMRSDPSGEAETARTASGMKSEDATDATEAETPPENLRKLQGEFEGSEQPGASAGEAIDRATAAVGHDDGKR